jgi:hypothetical protein
MRENDHEHFHVLRIYPGAAARPDQSRGNPDQGGRTCPRPEIRPGRAARCPALSRHVSGDQAGPDCHRQRQGCAARLAGRDIPKYEDCETSFAELAERIAKTLAFLDTVGPGEIDGSEERDISLQAGGQTHEFKGLAYLTTWVLPNFYFHVTTAYAILRHNGVEITKKDFLG